MDLIVLFKKYKVIIITCIILTIPVWLPVFSYMFSSLLNVGRVCGTCIRLINNNTFCPF
ncbi:MAG: hypothetical protein Q4E75_04130 [bacterium]|nr:hypothetical protein [bacterium]